MKTTRPDDTIVNDRHWELTSYEWNPKTGISRFSYVHRFTGRRVEMWDLQTKYLVKQPANEVGQPQELRDAA